MAMERVGEILKMADRAHTAALAFNCMDYSMIHAVVTAAEALNKPTLIMEPNKTLAAQVASEMKELFPHNCVVYCVSYYDY